MQRIIGIAYLATSFFEFFMEGLQDLAVYPDDELLAALFPTQSVSTSYPNTLTAQDQVVQYLALYANKNKGVEFKCYENEGVLRLPRLTLDWKPSAHDCFIFHIHVNRCSEKVARWADLKGWALLPKTD